MSVTPKVLVQPVLLAVATTTQYTVPAGTRCIIDKATVVNTTATTRTFSVYLVPSGGSVAASNYVVESRAVVSDETYLCPELVGQVLPPGDSIATEASAATALALRISGREVT